MLTSPLWDTPINRTELHTGAQKNSLKIEAASESPGEPVKPLFHWAPYLSFSSFRPTAGPRICISFHIPR